ncbi:MAG: glutathione S-transferase C-terminal domain-containing protein [Enhygromyxa sp.]
MTQPSSHHDPALTLYQFPPALGLPISESPPCAKVEVYLRLVGRPYTLELGDTRRSPNKMVPFVRWPDGTLQGESGDIIGRIEAEQKLDAELDPDRLAHGQRVAARVEEVVYDACLYDRFVDPVGWRLQRPITRGLIAQFIPAFVAPLATVVVRWKQVRRAKSGEMGDPKTGYAAAIEALEQTAALLGSDPYLCGDRPSTVDCAIWPNVVHLAATPNSSPARDAARAHTSLQAWMLRFGVGVGMPIEPSLIGATGGSAR